MPYGCTRWVAEKKIYPSSGRSIRGCLNRPDWIQTGKQPNGHFLRHVPVKKASSEGAVTVTSQSDR